MQKNIVIIATASRTSGVYSIYKQFIATLQAFVEGRLSSMGYAHEEFRFFVFLDPTMEQTPLPNVKYIPVETIGLQRITFDLYGLKRLLKEHHIRPDAFVSFQNTGVRYDKTTPWLIYYQNPLAHERCRWLPFKKTDRTLFFYSALYPTYMRWLMPRRADIVVQVPFLRPAFAKTFRHSEQQITVLYPQLALPDTTNVVPYEFEPNTYNFYFPAAGYVYKRHDLLIKALAILKKRTPALAERLRLHFTSFAPEERQDLQALTRSAGLEKQVCFHGKVSFTTILQLYKSADALLFPSDLETLGVPLLEAGNFGLPVLVADHPYAHEVIGHYAGAKFVEPNNPEAWAEAIAEQAQKQERFTPPAISTDNSWETFLRIALEKATNGSEGKK